MVTKSGSKRTVKKVVKKKLTRTEKKAQPIKKMLFFQGRSFAIRNVSQDYHTQHGFVKKADLKRKSGTLVKTSKGVEMLLVDPTFMDRYEKMGRGAQVIPQKDIGLIITRCGIGKNSVIVDAGAGSGGNACMLGNIAKKVYTCEVRDDHLDIVKKNIKVLDMKNVIAKKMDIYEKSPVKNADVFILDVPEPWQAIETVENTLKVGGYLVSYSPCIPQVMDFKEAIEKRDGFMVMDTVEVGVTVWEIQGRKVRPRSIPIVHSGFMTFVRKVA